MVYNLLPTLRNWRKALHVFKGRGFWEQSLIPYYKCLSLCYEVGLANRVCRSYLCIPSKPTTLGHDVWSSISIIHIYIVSKYCVRVFSLFSYKVQWRIAHLDTQTNFWDISRIRICIYLQLIYLLYYGSIIIIISF